MIALACMIYLYFLSGAIQASDDQHDATVTHVSRVGIRANGVLPEVGLSDYQQISSQHLGYTLQYRVFFPKVKSYTKLPVIYLTDGPGFIYYGKIIPLIERLIKQNKIEPVIAVFVDSREPENLKNNRRNLEFFCNPKYASFFIDELVPSIDTGYPTVAQPSHRVIAGLSFGGLNAACFGLLANHYFGGIGMLSPAMHPVPAIFEYYQQSEKLPLKFFLSTGTVGDNEGKTRRFLRILKEQGYPVQYKEVRNGRHDWKNWKPLLDDLLIYFFAKKD
ncbi:alpha/beta hydrolase [Aliikangiella maris]|uniref:Alpha/beta hydrolase-fold protein n=2 Tax=Aliikangiella maris TaxID=3162458 RepID=A0ABV2BXB6_9GAMM